MVTQSHDQLLLTVKPFNCPTMRIKQLGMPNCLLSLLRLDTFLTLGPHDTSCFITRYKTPTIFPLSSQKVLSLINFLDYLAFLHTHAHIVWPFFDILVYSLLHNSWLPYAVVWLVWPITSFHLPTMWSFVYLCRLTSYLKCHLGMQPGEHICPKVMWRFEDNLGLWPPTGSFQGAIWELARP